VRADAAGAPDRGFRNLVTKRAELVRKGVKLSRSVRVSRRLAIAAVTAGSLALTAGCGNGAASSSAAKVKPPRSVARKATPAASVAPAAKPNGRKVGLRRTGYGKILVDGNGRALYLFTREKPGGKPRCYGACAGAWPPYLSRSLPRAGAKIAQGRLGTVKRSDGRTQATYNGHPLYHYVGDRQPGQVLCQAVLEYGGYWYVVNRAGDAVK
jgi:predicted lipoprotein with Yx(FWY)xxD motif